MTLDHVRATGALLVAVCVYQVVAFGRASAGRRRLSKHLVARLCVLFIVLLYLLWARAGLLLLVGRAEALEPEAFIHGRNALARGAGLVVFLAGNVLVAWARAALGRELRPPALLPEPGSRLVLRGPYAWIRHPIYLGDLLTAAGLALVVGSWTFVAAGLAILVFLPGTIAHEERLLGEAFGEAFAAYRLHSHRLVPGVW
jgi:protein-S-isoprenylcysteine O-methyltransferase Ste14